eukprot:scaffold353_cov185-Amphora_coffeaeformis.AAC.10
MVSSFGVWNCSLGVVIPDAGNGLADKQSYATITACQYSTPVAILSTRNRTMLLFGGRQCIWVVDGGRSFPAGGLMMMMMDLCELRLSSSFGAKHPVSVSKKTC